MNRYLYVDLETTASGGPEGNSPEAHWRSNRVLMCGYCGETGPVRTDGLIGNNLMEAIQKGVTPVIVAHNAKFDLKYLMRDYPSVSWDKVKVWDTMTFEYRHSGQRHKMWSLEKLANAYGVPFKKSLNLGDLLSQGIKMEDIDPVLLKEYLIEDVEGLRRIHEYQLQCNYTPDMDYILPLAEMELNGMQVEREKAQQEATLLVGETTTVEDALIKHIRQCCEWQDGTPLELEDFTDQLGTKSKYIKPTANRTVSFLLTGEPAVLNITAKWQVKYKDSFGPYYRGTLPPYFVSNSSKHLGYPVDENVLQQDSSWIAREILEYRKANKLLSTYLGPMLHTSAIQGTVHPKLNTAITATGRLSSSNPNGQNMPEEARQLIHGNLITELDFSQLEMVAVACISKDKNLISDLSNGVDIHYNTAAQVFGAGNAKTMRKIAKNVNFGLLYGGKATGLSHQTGVDKNKVQKLIDAFYSRYPRVAKWQKEVFETVVDNMYPLDIKNGEQRYASEYTENVSRRRFTFIEQESPAWLRRRTGRKFSFSPQQTSNYPIQGFAGGDIVMDVLTRLWRATYRTPVKYIMTVHDSIILEVPPEFDIAKEIDKVLVETEAHFKLPIQLKYDLSQDTHWK